VGCLSDLIVMYVIYMLSVFGRSWGDGDRSGTVGGRPPDASLEFYIREAFQSQTNTEKIIQQESLGADMLWELKNSNYTRCHIELINKSCGGWLVSTLF